MIAVRKALQTMQNYQNFNMKLSPYNIPITRIMEGYESCDRHFKTVFHVREYTHWVTLWNYIKRALSKV